MPLDLSLIDQEAPKSAFVAPPPKQDYKLSPAFMAAPIVGNTLDGVSTAVGIGKGGEEANPIMAPIADHPAVVIAAKTGLGIGEALLLQKLAKKHPTVAKILAIVSGAVPAAAAVHNFTTKPSKP